MTNTMTNTMTKKQNLMRAARLAIKLHLMVHDTGLTTASVGVGLVRQDSTEKAYADVNRILGASYPDALICALIREVIADINNQNTRAIQPAKNKTHMSNIHHYITPGNSRSVQSIAGESPEDAVNKARILTDIPNTGMNFYPLVALSSHSVAQPHLPGKPTYIYVDAQRVNDGHNMTVVLSQVD